LTELIRVFILGMGGEGHWRLSAAVGVTLWRTSLIPKKKENRMSTRMGQLLVILGFVFMSSFGRGEIIVVPDQYSTIQAGVEAGNTGDTVMVREDRYMENINFGGHSVLLASFYLATLDTSDISATIIDGGGSGSVLTVENGEAATILGFTITGGSDSQGAGIYCVESAPVVRSNYIIGNDGPALYCQNLSGLIYGNKISANAGSGIIFDHCLYPIAERNIIFGNSSSAPGGAIQCSGSAISLIANTITANSALSGGAIYINDTSTVNLTNDILWGDSAPQGPEVFSDDDSYLNFTYSDIQGGWPGEGNINSDPMFCSPFTHNFYLARHSPCVGAGENGENIGAFDIGCEEVGVSSEENLPEAYFMAGSYPNPFNSSCTIFFVLAYSSHVKIDIFDLRGRKVVSVTDANYEAGFHDVTWNASSFPSGLYFARLNAAGRSQGVKLVLLK
jgi:hypothetical protein